MGPEISAVLPRRQELQYGQARGTFMAKPELGTKRVDPDTGRKFYDLNKDPIVSPYTGKSYPRSFFENDVKIVEEEEEETVADELDQEDIEVVPLEDAEDDDAVVPAGSPDIDEPEDDVIELDDDDADDTFLADDEEEEDDDVSVIIKVGKDEEDQ
jgi:uncharacterized protein (TIGR02300 family)